MEERRPGKLKVWTPLLFSFIMIFGMILGFNLRDSLRSKRDIQTVMDRNDRLEQIIDLINEKYVDSVQTDLLYEDAVNGILSHLDPHTVYIPAEELQEVNEDLEGSFFGIGVEFSIVKDTIQVTSIVEGGPAEKAGVEAGDQLIKVEDSIVAGKGITSPRIIKMLRGEQYSKVNLTLRSPYSSKLKKAVIERDAIPIYSVDASLMLDSVTGFIRINRFSATTYEEFSKALKSLKSKGAKQLVLDLRQNPGGYLDAATSIADEFLDDDKLIVYTKGSRSEKIEYKADNRGMFEKGKLVVLVDEGSASASEVLAGAIQDWDRGVIVGRRSFGKGLVQTQFDLDDGSALRLTIARYYTPSGRSIQRSFQKGKEAYADDFSKRFETGELTGNDSLALADTTRYFTSRKRLVYGGGGIHPDVYVPYDSGRINSGVMNIIFSEKLKDVLWSYFVQHRSDLKKYRSVQDYDRSFRGDELVRIYSFSLSGSDKTALDKFLASQRNKDYFSIQLKAQLGRYLFRNNGYYAVYSHSDNVVQKALQVLYGKGFLSLVNR
jgi:carboxyl-terminal processing protease